MNIKHKKLIDRKEGGELANLTDADLSGADLANAKLVDANLADADLSGADLANAKLVDANLSGAILANAKLVDANLSGALGILQVGPGGSRKDYLYAVMWDDGVRIKDGGFWGTLNEFVQEVEETHANDRHGEYYRAAIGFIKAWEKGMRNGV